MLPLILAIAGGYLIASSTKSKEKFADGGQVGLKNLDVQFYKTITNREGNKVLILRTHYLDKKPLSKLIQDAKDNMNALDSHVIIEDKAIGASVAKIHADGKVDMFREGYMEEGGEITKEDCKEIFYVMDGSGKVKSISTKREDALSFLNKSLKGDGKLSSRVVLKTDWDSEKINTSNIKNWKEPDVGFYSNDEIWGMDEYAEGGVMAESKYECYTTDYYGSKSKYGGEKNLTLDEAAEWAYRYTKEQYPERYDDIEKLTKDISNISEGKDMVISDNGMRWNAIVIEKMKKMASGGKIEVVMNEGNGKVINQLYNEWNKIKTNAQQNKWAEKVRNTKFGTYGTISLMDVLDKFNFDESHINSVNKEGFKKEIKTALKYQYADGGGIMKHKHIAGMTIELIEPTNKGWKVRTTQINSPVHPYGKLRTPKVKMESYSKQELKDLFDIK